MRFAISGVLAAAVLAPSPAYAWRAASDQVAGTPLSKGEIAPAQAPSVKAAAGILVTSEGRVLWSRRGDERRAMASTTKMMTALLVLEKGGLNKKVKISKRASRVPYGLGLKAGERVSVRRLLELTLVSSSNDAAYALGEYVSGSMPAFVRKMNERARALGLKNTRFANPHGLDALGHYSSPADLAQLSQKAMKDKEFRRIVKMRKVYMPAHKGRAGRNLKNTDKLLGSYPGILGVKTGYTRHARYSFVASAKRDGVTLTAVILGAENNSARFTESARLMNWGFKNLEFRELPNAKKKAGEVSVASNPDVKVPVRIEETKRVQVFAPEGRVRRETSLKPEVALPVFKGQPLGEVRFVQGKRVLAKMPAVAAKSAASVEETVGAVPVSDYLDKSVPARTAEVKAKVPKFDPETPVEQRVDLTPQVAAPVSAGDTLGEVTYSQDGEVIVRVPVVAAESVEPPTFVENVQIAVTRGWRGLVGGQPMAQLEVVTP